MLSATNERWIQSSRLRTTVILERRVRIFVIERDRLLFDSSFHPVPRRQVPGVTLSFTLAGVFQVAGGAAHTARVAFALASDELESRTETATTFRTWGAPSLAIEMRVRAEDVRVPIGLTQGPFVVSPSAWDATRKLAELAVVDGATAPDVRSPSRTYGYGARFGRSTARPRRPHRSST